tara:strand:+ start:757 stop:1518 length:762 start_codon:yes stop_codon:yes gene_type:complete
MDQLPERDRQLCKSLLDYAKGTWGGVESDRTAELAVRILTKQRVLEQIEVSSDSENVDLSLLDLPLEMSESTIVRYILTLNITLEGRKKYGGVKKHQIDHIINIFGIYFVDMHLNAVDSDCLISIVVNSTNVPVKQPIQSSKSTALALAPKDVAVRRLTLKRVGQVIDNMGTAVVKTMSDYLFGSAYVEEFELGKRIKIDLGEEVGERTGKKGKRAYSGAETLDKEIISFEDKKLVDVNAEEQPSSEKKRRGE